MNIPRDEISGILIFHRRHGSNFVLYVLGILSSNRASEELVSTFYRDPKIMQIELNSIMRFIKAFGFKFKKKYPNQDGDDILMFEK